MTGVEIEIGGKSRRLRYDFNAVADIEQKAGLGIGTMFGEERVGFNSIRLLIWGGLRWRERGLTVDRAGQYINDYITNGQGDLGTLMDAAQEALEQSGIMRFEEVEDEPENTDAEEAGNMGAETAL